MVFPQEYNDDARKTESGLAKHEQQRTIHPLPSTRFGQTFEVPNPALQVRVGSPPDHDHAGAGRDRHRHDGLPDSAGFDWMDRPLIGM